MPLVELFRRRKQVSVEKYDEWMHDYGVKMEVADLLEMRDLEDYWIKLGQSTEENRYPVPDYLIDEWTQTFGVNEVNRVRSSDD